MHIKKYIFYAFQPSEVSWSEITNSNQMRGREAEQLICNITFNTELIIKLSINKLDLNLA